MIWNGDAAWPFRMHELPVTPPATPYLDPTLCSQKVERIPYGRHSSGTTATSSRGG